MQRSVTVLTGTTKGAFLLRPSQPGGTWRVEGPFCDGWPINHVIGDPETGRLWAAGGGEFPGAGVWRSEDMGRSWTLAKLANGQFDAWLSSDPELAGQLGREAAPPAPFTERIDALWSLALSHGTLYAGAKPAGLFASEDGGENWREITTLTDHPSADSWQPGAAGLTLHTIVPDPASPSRLWLGISAAGVFATEDGCKSWERRNRLSNAPAVADTHPADGRDGETGHCVHNMVLAPGGAEDAGARLYQQNHHGVFRSPDGGRSWEDVTGGLPSRFGFPVAVHPTDPDTIWVLPLNGDMAGRYPPDAAAAVWRSRDGGRSWEAMRTGLPQEGCFFTVLRQAMATGGAAPAEIYFGTNTGSVFASDDDGDSWREIARHLPSVLSVEVLETG